MKSFNERREDAAVLPLIKSVMEDRPTYGYKRVTAMVNKRFKRKYNKKRIYRLMRKESLMLPRAPRSRRDHPGTGKVMVPRSNMRWCSDCFEIHCWTDERVFVAFALDCCDREVIHFLASKQDILSTGIQQLMVQSVENRFGFRKVPRTIEWLTDRGSIYKSKQTQEVAHHLGLKPCFTAAYSPSSNGMAEAFVATFKRDYVYTNDCIDADWVIENIGKWVEDYNSHAPHSALKMLSPREFKALSNQAG